MWHCYAKESDEKEIGLDDAYLAELSAIQCKHANVNEQGCVLREAIGHAAHGKKAADDEI